jgi:hypothetical protein
MIAMGLSIPDFVYIICMMIKYNVLDIFLVESGLHIYTQFDMY